MFLFPKIWKKRNALIQERSAKYIEYSSLKTKVAELEKARKTIDDFFRQEKMTVPKKEIGLF